MRPERKRAPLKPWGFWKRPETREVLRRYINGELSETKATEILQCGPGDVRWYANELKRTQKAIYEPTLGVDDEPAVERLTIGEGGRLVIPASYRDRMGVREGSEVILSYGDGELRIRSLEHALRRARVLVRHYVPEERSLADELIAERRREASRE